MSRQPPEQAKTSAGQQQAKTAGHAALIVHQPNPAHAQTSESCPGTSEARFDCNTLSAIANVRQADAAERFNILAGVEIGIGFATAIAAILAANWARKAAHHARSGVAQAMEANEIARIAAANASNTATSTLYHSQLAAREAREATDRSYSAFVAAEDANLFVQFFNGGALDQRIDGGEVQTFYSFNVRITNIGRSSAILHWWSVGDERGSFNGTLKQDEAHVIGDRIMLATLDPFDLVITYSTGIRPRAKLTVSSTLWRQDNPARTPRASVESHRIEEEQ